MPRVRQKKPTYLAKDFQKAVKARLALLGLKQKDLAEALGVQDGTVSYMLQKPESIQVARLREMIRILELEPETVLRLYGYPEKAVREAAKSQAGFPDNQFS